MTPAVKAAIDKRVAELLAMAPPLSADKIPALASIVAAARRELRSREEDST